jgi:RimJ/RimL family protein N-acetyltransferase
MAHFYHHKNGTLFRNIERSDLMALQNLRADSWWGTHSFSWNNMDDQERWYDNIPSNMIVLIGETVAEPTSFLGCCIIKDIDWLSRTASISGAVESSQRSPGQSLCSFQAGLDFSFEMLNLHRLNAEVAEYHYPAMKIEIEELGFQIEGTKRQSIYKCGRYYNSYMLGMLREDWLEHPRVLHMNGSCCKNFDHRVANRLIQRGLERIIRYAL